MRTVQRSRFVQYLATAVFCLLLSVALLPSEAVAQRLSCPTSSSCSSVTIYNFRSFPYSLSLGICSGNFGACLSPIIIAPASGGSPSTTTGNAPNGSVINGICSISPAPPNFYFDEASCIMYIW